MSSSVNGRAVIAAEIVLPLTGNWSIDLQLDSTEKLTGEATLDSEGVTFVGTAVRPVIEGGRSLARIVGGAGGLHRQLGATNYVNTTVRGVLSDAIREAGERLSGTSDAGILGAALSRWERAAGEAWEAIAAVVEHAGANWRMLADGTIWVGRDTWPEQKLESVHIDRSNPAVIELAPERPDLRPGVTFQGEKIRLVVHYLSTKLRTEAYVQSLADTFAALFAPLRRAIDYSRLYPARVSRQNADGTVQVVADDPAIKGAGLDKVPIRLGVPGSVLISSGQRVLIGFASGDPSRPFAVSWERDAVDELRLGSAVDFVALASKVLVELQSMQTWASTHTHSVPIVGPAGTTPSTPPLVPPPSPNSVAAAKVKAE